MSVKILALVLIVTLARTVLTLGLKQVKKKGYHILREENGKIYVGRGRTERGHAPGKLRGRKSTLGTGKKIPAYKNALFRPNDKDEITQNELLVKELALSSDIGGVKRHSLKTKIKKHNIPKRKHLAQKTRMNVITRSPISDTISKKRTSIAFPSSASGRSLPEHDAPMSRTLLTAVGLLLDEKNHFEKDSNALSLAKVLLNIDKNASEKHITHGSDSLNMASSLGGLSNILRLLNASVSQESPGGERKSTIHTELINPTELGISILRLLFGHQAPLVMKATYKPSLRYNPTMTISPAANPVFSPSRLASQMDEFAKGKSIPRKKRHKKTFTFALAKAVSDLIKSMAKQELRNYLQKIHNQPKFFKQTQSLRIPNSFWSSKKKVDVQGNRKSWVLLKIPRAGDEAVPQQMMNDEHIEEKQSDKEKSSTGIVDTLGKLNEADPLSLETLDKNIGGPSMSGANSEIKLRPTSRVGYKVRILPSLKASVGKQTDSSRVSEKPARSPQPSPQTTAAFAEAVKTLLQAVQSSIKTLQSKKMIGHLSNVPSTVSDQPPKVNQRNVASIVSDRPPRVSETTNTGSVRGMSREPTPINAFQQDKIQPVLEDIHVPKQPSIGELSAFTRAAGQNELPVHGNDLFDPLKDLELAASEHITKTISPTKRLSPTDNVLFESATELGTTRDKQESSTVKHIKEDLELFAEKGLQEHNHFREQHHSSRLRWSDELATQAEKMAYDMAMRGIVERSEVATGMGYGENVAKITGVPFNDAGSVATDIWYSESSNYSYSYPSVTPQTDAFTQLVWKETKEIGMGCAKDVATNDLYVVALYRPPGNDRRRLRDNVVNKGTMTEDVYATIFKRTQQDKI